MTEFYDVEKMLTSLGIGEAAVTVLSPRGVPTPLAATRLIAPDSQMAPIPDDQFAALVAASPLQMKYGTTVDRQSAYEILRARIQAAQQAVAQQAAAQQVAAQPAVPAGMPATTAAGQVTMTPAEVRRMQQQAARDAREQEKAAERQRREAAAEAKRERVAQERAARQHEREINSAIRTGGRVLTSRAGQSLIRGVFGTFFGK
jgi:hypothetical protein